MTNFNTDPRPNQGEFAPESQGLVPDNSEQDAIDPADANNGPAMAVTIGAGEPTVVSTNNLDDTAWADFRNKSEQTTEAVQIQINELAGWPDAARWPLFQLIRDLDGRVTVKVGEKNFTEPFQAVLAAMVGADDLQRHQMSLRAAKEAAAVFAPGAVDTVAGLINTRLKDLGVQPIRCDTLAKEIRALCGGGPGGVGDDDDVDAQALAHAFVQDHLAKLGVAGEDQVSLCYYCSEFYEFTGKIWRSIPDDQFRAMVTGFLQEHGVPKISGKLVSDVMTNLEAIALFGNWKIDLPFWIESSEPPVAMANHNLVFQNGTLNLDEALESESPILRMHDSRIFSTNLLPFDYDPEAQCPRFLQFLDEVLPRTCRDDHRQEVLQEFGGYTLLTDCRFEKMLALLGEGNNGKSVELKVWQAMLGDANVSHVEYSALGQEFRLHDLRGKAANFSSEIDHFGRAREGLLKQLISGERVNVNRKHLPPVEITPHAKLVVATNELPTLVDTSNGIWRRLIIMPFEVVIADNQVNRNLANELMAELPGIFNWSLAGLRRLIRQNRFTACAKCRTILEDHRTTSDSVADFVADACTIEAGWDVHGQHFYEVYHFACEAKGRKPVAENQFGVRLKRLGVGKRRAGPTEEVSRPWLYTGIRLTGPGNEWVKRYTNLTKTSWEDLHYHVLVERRPGRPGSVQASTRNPDRATPVKAAG